MIDFWGFMHKFTAHLQESFADQVLFVRARPISLKNLRYIDPYWSVRAQNVIPICSFLCWIPFLLDSDEGPLFGANGIWSRGYKTQLVTFYIEIKIKISDYNFNLVRLTFRELAKSYGPRPVHVIGYSKTYPCTSLHW